MICLFAASLASVAWLSFGVIVVTERYGLLALGCAGGGVVVPWVVLLGATLLARGFDWSLRLAFVVMVTLVVSAADLLVGIIGVMVLAQPAVLVP